MTISGHAGVPAAEQDLGRRELLSHRAAGREGHERVGADCRRAPPAPSWRAPPKPSCCESALLRPAQRPAAPRRWKGHSVARAAVRPAAPVRLGRGGEPPGLISPTGVFPCSRARQAPAPGSMLAIEGSPLAAR